MFNDPLFDNALKAVVSTPGRNPYYQGFAICALAMGLTGCDFVGTFAKEMVVAASSHRGWSTFTFKGQLPAEFGIDAIAFYGPDDPSKSRCRAATFTPGKTVTRQHGQRYTAAISDQPQAFSFDIPLSYYEGLCGMKLGRVALEIKVRYGKEKWQKTYADGNIYTGTTANPRTSYFDASGVLNINAECSFMFQESKLYLSLSKLMNCKGPGAHLLRENISGKIVNLVITANSEEEPSRHDTWIKFPNGWKPCLPRKGFQRCQVPALFKTFQMNGQTCTVYPGCTE